MKLLRPIRIFLKDSRATGALLLVCAIASIVVSNSSFSTAWFRFWEHPINTGPDLLHLPHNIRLFVNEILMTIFFFSAGLEIKKELISGQLNSVRKALMPVMSAMGGMLLPALIYIACTLGHPGITGWGIPMATDIAFSLAILSLLGNRAPLSMRIFLTAVAIIDDVGGILTIAFFYSGQKHWDYLLLASVVTLLLALFHRIKSTPQWLYLIGGVVLWYFVYNSGVHATIAGVVTALFIPTKRIHSLEHALRVPVNFVILPLFALANTAVALPADVAVALLSRVHFAVFCGLVLGKPLGILLFTWLAIKLKIASLPGDMNLKQVSGVGMVAGIGFTVSLFITTLAFTSQEYQLQAKLAILDASVIAGILGYIYLRISARKLPLTGINDPKIEES